ncbi:class I SAM-dependent methyltransferase [Minwuia sp.]|uniref:class I SAM-dependent methyltransferase n=1 Tax=Minwuia sp. TaxID=2493630 RepID=UPI003A90726F
MSSAPDNTDTPIEAPPEWLFELIGFPNLGEGEKAKQAGTPIAVRDGIVRVGRAFTDEQTQTRDAFDFKWHQRATYDSPHFRAKMKAWLIGKYGDPADEPWLNAVRDRKPVVLDAGCGAAFSALEYFGPYGDRINYVGVDISEAVDVARMRFAEEGIPGAFMQCDLMQMPFPDGSVDAIFSEGVLHHTPSTRDAIIAVARKLRSGGTFMFYVYKRKGPIREFTDDYIRDRIADMNPEEAWAAIMPLTKLGHLLGELDIEIDVPEAIDVLDIPAGKINLQRLFYWHIFKAYHDPDFSMDEMNHINFDWYSPAYAFRQSPDEVRAWCAEAGLNIRKIHVEEAGITVVADKV